MADRYLSEKDVIQALEAIPEGNWKHIRFTKAIRELPAADVRDLVKATKQPADEQPYFRKHYHRVCCSNCHREIVKSWKFCPDCGATFVEDGNGK